MGTRANEAHGDHPGRDVRARVVTAATKAFAKRGFDAASLQEIAAAVGITKPAILHHFPSKEDLRIAVLSAILDHWRERLPNILLAATASGDRFDSVLGELLSFFSADPDRARLVLREILDRPDAMRDLMRAHVRPWLGAIALYIDRGKARGEHHADVDAEAYVVHVLCLVITAVASGPVTRVAAGSEARARAELVRIARASLFAPRASDAPLEAAREAAPAAPQDAPQDTRRTPTKRAPRLSERRRG